MEITTERVEIPGPDGTFGGTLARPTGPGPHPSVLVFMEIFGINAHIRDVTERIAREGYVALAPDFFHRTGPGIELAYDAEGFQKGFALLEQLKAEEMVSDARAAFDFVQGRADTTEQVGAIGFCIGGHMAYLAACELPLAATASFYGGGVAGETGPGGAPSTLGRTKGISGEILCLWAEKDEFIPASQVEAVRAALAEAGIRHDTVVYPGADHGFFCDQRDNYQAEAARDAWSRVKELFHTTLRG